MQTATTFAVPDNLPLGEVWPRREDFLGMAADRRVIPVLRRFLADEETPLSIYRKLAGDGPHTYLLESAVEGQWARYSFIGAASVATLTSRDGEAHWLGEPPVGLPTSGNPLDALRDSMAALHTPAIAGLPAFTGGMVGYVSYDAVRHWEKLPDQNPDELGVPELSMMIASDVAIYDHRNGTVTLVANAINHNNEATGAEAAYEDALARVDAMLENLLRPLPSSVSTYALENDPKVDYRIRKDQHEKAVRQAIEHIVDGDAFQVVVSQRFDVASSAHPVDVYRVVRSINPSPYMFIVRTLDGAGRPLDVVGASPEALVTVQDGRAIMHPIAGSRPRGETAKRDHELGEDLLGDDKETSEHLMLVDLARNDMQRFCEPGSVEVTEFMQVHRFSHIMHLVSTVEGRVSPGRTAYDALACTFPAGTLSGAPKPMAMRIIDTLEVARRGIYGGTIGYLDFAGNMDMAIAIRTAVLREGSAHVQAGGGIVADSQTEAEYEETVNKAAAMVRAVASAASLAPARPEEGR
ncbi:anthranilate synthase component I [Micrococcales bacterium 31B]|nr:anthranilate synthase component I [Micrococcales bacterium 31B]